MDAAGLEHLRDQPLEAVGLVGNGIHECGSRLGRRQVTRVSCSVDAADLIDARGVRRLCVIAARNPAGPR